MEELIEQKKFDSEAKNKFTDKLTLLQKALGGLRTIQLDKACTEERLAQLKEIPAFLKFFQVPLNSLEELEMKKRFVRALIIAKEKECLPFPIPEDPEEIALLVDEGLHTAKVAYMVATGKISTNEAFDEIYDKSVSTVATVVNKVVRVGFPFVVDKAVDFIAAKFPPVKPFTDTVKTVIASASGHVADAVSSGIKKVANVAKPLVKSVVKTLDKAYQSVKSGVRNLWSKVKKLPSILSWF